jgi:Icc-related predicted phosphoesterase
MAKAKLMFATDLHGSETVWRKFLNTAKIYDVDALVLSGDMTGKIMVPIIKRPDGKYDAHLINRPYVLNNEAELEDFKKRVRMISYLPYVTTTEEAQRIGSDEQYREDLFERLECEIVDLWMKLIPERVPAKCKVIISPGNDDKFAIDETIKKSPHVIFAEEDVVSLDKEHEVLCFGWSNTTPFNSPRECGEEEMMTKLEAVVKKVKNLKTAIFCIHVPPYDSQLDAAPQLNADLSVTIRGGRPQMIPVGSKAVRKIIEKYQPLLGLHGHIHESPGFIKIGRTECLNPGSEYAEGIFKGYLVEIDGDKIKRLQRIEG